ncbi:LysE family translocator [Marinobacterium sp. D7]|uniref:LysE family translocator n=1 Tax=Marinobacterium ramblicola TaxID=2849041 RepID=UPI001C2DE780|nr:LysE family translocator [Marinobacterium ramblicola]MBV1789043.1 LysE family translocator [Marinobacterium ramblicola]
MSSLVLSFSLFALIASATPGPTNVLALSNGSRFGTLGTLPFVIGASFGASAILLLTASGLTAALQGYPLLSRLPAWLGTLWLSWMAWKLYQAPAIDREAHCAKAQARWYQGALMQLVNPKTWIMALTASSLFAPVDSSALSHNLLLALIFFVVTLPCIAAWAWLGEGSGRLLRTEAQQQQLNRVLAVLLVVSVWFALLS